MEYFTDIRKRLSRAEKEANDKQWYRSNIDSLDTFGTKNSIGYGGISDFDRMRVNYDLYNNIINLQDFEYIVKPYGAKKGELPAKFTNRDIISNKIKTLLGMEMKMPFDYKVVAINSEATTRREQAETEKIRTFVINTIMAPIKQQLELEAAQQAEGKQLTPEQQQQMQAQIAEQLKAMTPDEVKRYMERDHQDPAEIMCHQLLEYLVITKDAKTLHNEGFKHACIAGKEIYYVGDVNGEPTIRVANPIYFNHDITPEVKYIEDGEWATYEYRETLSKVISDFSDELTEAEIDELCKDYGNYASLGTTYLENYQPFRVGTNGRVENDVLEGMTIRVLHVTWKALRKIKFLTYMDENGEEQEMIVDESYKLNTEAGDIKIEVEWIPEVYEGYKIGKDIYKKMRPVPGQFKDMDNLYCSKLPYYGAVYDWTNSVPTSLVDRGKLWQYYLNIVYYRLELLMASDKGKKVALDLGIIPDNDSMSLEDFMHYVETSPFILVDTAKEGAVQSINQMSSPIDLSLASDISRYFELAERIKFECGEAMGISRQMEAQIQQNEAVGNTRQAIVQNTYILDPLFSLHNKIKRNVLSALLEVAKVCYSRKKSRKLSYILDDMSLQTLNLDSALLDNTSLGLYVSDSARSSEIKQTITQLAHAALQNQQIKLSDVLSVIKEDSITTAEEVLKKSEKEQQEFVAQQQERQIQADTEARNSANEMLERTWQHEKEMVILKAEEQRKTEMVKNSLLAASYNPDQDKDDDGQNDFVEMANKQIKLDLDKQKQQLSREKFDHQKMVDNQKAVLEREKLKMQKAKNQGKQ